ncbi:Gamma-aminobutyric acid type B receptor subunit 2 [Hondaea fermentalgiana]|uniref:Gamma-aminobutyric acid type B receptor subunit 2 n=1 Tax=Hondaea fermentalgiana TaxID=2315210 RepID=A0A2R5GSC9_9STRA|nr:Gamma-aminobutyric acid type B receptor subunit 2 [Hondaea fermentalgiana]|eukprot:GBG31271.1 Gamma-aminobutyric acid type B receptor subunit 2 [Hondaea fermentalgiana]
MMGRKNLWIVAFAVAAVLLARVEAAFTDAEIENYTQEEGVSTTDDGRIIVRGAGATFPERLYEQAIFAYRFVEPTVDVSYDGMGSGNGKCRIVQDCSEYEERPIIIDFAGSDSPVSDSQYVTKPSVQMYPSVAGAVVPIYNLPDLDALGYTLVLDLDILAAIFTLQITSWDDPMINATNAGRIESEDPALAAEVMTALENAGDIQIVVREDDSGTTSIFKKTLKHYSAILDDVTGTSEGLFTYSGINATQAVTRQGNEGVAGYVATQESSISYSVLGEALSLGISFASLSKSDGVAPVVANTETVSNALVEKGLNFESDLEEERLIVEVNNAQNSQAWPIVGYTYFVILKSETREGAERENVLAMQNFFEWFYENDVPRAIATSLAFAPLPDEVRETVLARLRADMTYDNELVYEAVDLSGTKASYFGTASLKNILAQYQLVYEAERTDVAFEDFIETTSEAAYALAATEGIAVMLGSAVDEAIQAYPSDNDMIRLPYAGVGVGVLMNLCGATASEQSTAACQITSSGTNEAGQNGINIPNSILEDLFVNNNSRNWQETAMASANPAVAGDLPNEDMHIVVVNSNVTDEFLLRFRRLRFSTSIGWSCDIPWVTCVDTIDAQKSAIAATPFSLGIMPILGSIPDLTEWAKLSVDPSSSSPTYVGPTTEAIQACFEADNAYDATKPSFTFQSSVECYPVVDTIDLIARKLYTSGANGGCNRTGKDFGIDNTRFIGFLAAEIIDGTEVVLEGSPLAAEGALALYGLNDLVSETNYKVLASITCDGDSILTPNENTQLVPLAFIVFAYTLTSLALLFCIAMVIWVQRNKRRRLLLVASPPFLLQILLGGMLSLSAIIPLAFQDDGIVGPSQLTGVDIDEEGAAIPAGAFDARLDLSCMLAPALYSTGFALVYSSLWLKTWRQIRVFNDERLRLQYITNNKLRIYQLCLFALLVCLFAFWWATEPLRYTRVIVETDEEGNVLESYGACRSDRSLELAAPIIAALGLSLVYGLYLSFRSRNIPSEFNEGRYITIAVIAAFEVLAISIPVFLSTSSDPTTNFILQVFIIFVTSAGTVMLIFVPKIIIRYSKGWENMNDGKSEVSDDEMSDPGNMSSDAFPFASASGEASLSFNRASKDPFKSSDDDPFQSF